VILDGPYQWVRHPMYLGYICMLAGLALANYSVAYFSLVPIHMVLLLYRARLEESRLSEYSMEYREYRKRTGFKFGDGFGPRPHLQFFVNAADVGVDGFVADAEFVGDFLVNQSLAQQVEHLLFALGKVFGGLRRRGRRFFGTIARLCARCAWSSANRRGGLPDGFQQLLGGGALEHVTAGARRQRVENVFRVLINREHHHLGLRQERLQLPHAFDAVHAGQVDVHEHDVGFDLRQILQRVLGAGITG
jgi:hypothetical protein